MRLCVLLSHHSTTLISYRRVVRYG